MAVIKVRVKPGSRRESVEFMEDGRFKVSIREPAREGKANRALIKLLSKKLGVPPSSITIKSGKTSRDKLVEIQGKTEAEIRERLENG